MRCDAGKGFCVCWVNACVRLIEIVDCCAVVLGRLARVVAGVCVGLGWVGLRGMMCCCWLLYPMRWMDYY